LREQDAEIASAREREAKVEKAVSAIRREIAPDDILTATATALLEASEAGACLVLGADSDGMLDPDHQAWAVTGAFGQLAVWSERGAVTKTLLERLDDLPIGDDAPHALRVDALGCLALVASHQNRRTGAICLLRPDMGDVAPWPASALSTLRMLNPSVSLALAQAAHMRSLETLSRTDGLTGTLNRRSFETDVRRHIADARSEGLDGALMYLDFDGFKMVNDTMGHAQGDTVLREFGERARKLLRTRDIFARLGGDEFAIWLHGVNEKGAEVAGERLCEAGRKLRTELELPEAFSISAGIALFDPESHETLEQLEARADAALYAAKRGGKDGWSMADAPFAEQPGRMQC
jgi:diguanylate cyclase (GGDEF)-like protein